MKLTRIILGIVVSQIFVLEETASYGNKIDWELFISCLLPASWGYFIYLLIVTGKKSLLPASFFSVHKWLTPIAVMMCIESLLVYVVFPLIVMAVRPVAIVLYYLWICRLTLLLTIPLSYKIIGIIDEHLTKLLPKE